MGTRRRSGLSGRCAGDSRCDQDTHAAVDRRGVAARPWGGERLNGSGLMAQGSGWLRAHGSWRLRAHGSGWLRAFSWLPVQAEGAHMNGRGLLSAIAIAALCAAVGAQVPAGTQLVPNAAEQSAPPMRIYIRAGLKSH